MKALIQHLGWGAKISVRVDPSVAKSTASRIRLGSSRHLEVKFLVTQEAVKWRRLEVVRLRGEVDPVDIMTKPKNNDAVKAVFDLYTSMEIQGRRRTMNENEVAAIRALAHSGSYRSACWTGRGSSQTGRAPFACGGPERQTYKP